MVVSSRSDCENIFRRLSIHHSDADTASERHFVVLCGESASLIGACFAKLWRKTIPRSFGVFGVFGLRANAGLGSLIFWRNFFVFSCRFAH